MTLLLASASPRRKALLALAGYALDVCPVDVDESVLPGELPEAYVERVVASKLEAAIVLGGERGRRVCLVADTVVLCDRRILGKPRDRQHARAMIAQLGGRKHVVASRYALAADGVHVGSETVKTEVWFRPLSAEQIERYVATGEGDDKAGAYAIQGIGGSLVERIVGSYTSVVGLPLAQVVAQLEALGVPCLPAPTAG